MVKKIVLSSVLILVIHASCYSQNTPTIILNEFAKTPFYKDILPSDIRSKSSPKFTMEKSVLKNKHSNGFDSLLVFKSAKCIISFIKTSNKTFFNSATITGSCIQMSKGVSIGMTQNQFKKSIGMSFKLDRTNTLIISDSTQYFYHAFFFKNGKLVKINLNSNPD